MTEEFSLSSLLLSHIFHFCFFILSHPLYFSYFVFFFPYLLRLLSFLSPLFTTTFLLVLAFFSFSHGHGHGGSVDQNDQNCSPSESKMGLLASSYQAVSGHENEEFDHSEELEWYKIVFETCRFETREIISFPVEEVQVEIDCSSSHASESEGEATAPYMKKKNLEEVEDDGEETKQIESEPETKDIEVVSKVEEIRDSSEAVEMKITSFGTTRKLETDQWRKTLACKLFEERYNVAVGNEEMDLLWETYETKESMGKVEVKISSSKKKDLRSWVNQKETEEGEEEEDDDDEGKICCLQALKFSTGKVKFGMGKRSSLMKISKAFKGIKLLHELSKNGKKRHS